jgi:hypothetical protein
VGWWVGGFGGFGRLAGGGEGMERGWMGSLVAYAGGRN